MHCTQQQRLVQAMSQAQHQTCLPACLAWGSMHSWRCRQTPAALQCWVAAAVQQGVLELLLHDVLLLLHHSLSGASHRQPADIAHMYL